MALTDSVLADAPDISAPSAVDASIANAMAAIILVTLTVWVAFSEDALKYVIYSLPFTLTAAYFVFGRWQLRANVTALTSLGLYLACALTSMVLNSWFGFYGVRDLAIVGGYLFLFVLWFRAPSATADMALVSLAVGLVVEGMVEGVSEDVNLFGSNGILESTLAFPIGAVLLYFLHVHRWGRVVVSGILLFLAFKRITFLGVALAVLFDLLVSRSLSLGKARRLALALVLILSVLALFSTQLFEYVATTLNLEQTNANSISLGRYAIATQLWQDIASRAVGQFLIGNGPGSADSVVAAQFQLINPHNDWLKVLYDYGVIGLAVVHIVLYRNLTEHRLAIMLYVYGATLMMTDNIFIYMFYHPFVLLMIAAARR